MRHLVVILCAVSIVGCVTTPQTRDEMKESMRQHSKLGLAETYIANRDLDSVAKSLERKWRECYDVSVTTTRATSTGMTTSRYQDNFHPKVRRIGNSKVEMTLQVTTKGMVMLNKVPEGGEYRVALDLERAPGNKTKLAWYSPRWGWEDGWRINKQWADGKDVPCP